MSIIFGNLPDRHSDHLVRGNCTSEVILVQKEANSRRVWDTKRIFYLESIISTVKNPIKSAYLSMYAKEKLHRIDTWEFTDEVKERQK